MTTRDALLLSALYECLNEAVFALVCRPPPVDLARIVAQGKAVLARADREASVAVISTQQEA